MTHQIPTLVKPHITQVYSRHENPPVLSQTLATSLSYPIHSDDILIALRKGKHRRVHRFPPFVIITMSSHSCSFIASLDSSPSHFREDLSHLGWCSAMIEEMDALNDNGTWDLVQLPARKKVIKCRWVFAVKVNPDGSVARLKARLVAKGYAYTYGVDY